MTEPSKHATEAAEKLDYAAHYGNWCYRVEKQHAAGVIQEAIDAATAELQKFKAYVHKRLDDAGVPVDDPDSEHSKAGCRIGARLDMLFAELAARDAEIATLRQELETLQTDNEVNATGHRLRLIAWKPTKP
jgi:hypothetical protein